MTEQQLKEIERKMPGTHTPDDVYLLITEVRDCWEKLKQDKEDITDLVAQLARRNYS